MKQKGVVFLILISPATAWAYLDPGSEYLILQALFAGLGGALAILKLYGARLKDFFKRCWLHLTQAKQAVSHSELETSPNESNKN